MSLLGRLLSRFRGQPDPPRAGYGPSKLEAELPYLHEQIRAYASVAPVRISGPAALDNFTGETAEMRLAYRRAFAEPSIKAALLGKIAAVQALGLNVKPANDTPLDQAASDFVKHTLNRTGTGTPGLSGIPLIVWEILGGGLMDGFSACEKVWKREPRGRFKGKIGLGDLKAKDSRYIQYELDSFRNVTAVIGLRGNPGTRFAPTDFVLFNYLSLFRNPFGTSDLRSSYRAASMIPVLLNLRMIFLDKYTGPYIHGKTNDPAMVETMKAKLAQARSEGFVVTSKEEEIVVIDLAMSATADFQAGLDDLRKECAIGISGAFLTMMTGEGGSGTRGDSSVQQDTVDLFIWLLAVTVASCINGQIVPDLIGVNYGDAIDYPIVSLEAPNPEQIVNELAIDRELYELGVPLDPDDLYERTGRRPPKDPAKAIQKTTGGGLPGMGGPPGAGGQPQPGGDPFAGLDDVFGEEMDDEGGGGPAPDPGDGPGFTGVKRDAIGRKVRYVQGRRVAHFDEADEPALFDEAGRHFTGTLTDSAGRKRTYRDGKQVAGQQPAGSGKDASTTTAPSAPKPPGSEHAPTQDQVAQEVTAGLSPEAKAKPGVVEKVMGFVAKVYTSPRLFNAAVKVGMLVHEYAPDILDTAEDYESPAKAKTATGQPVGAATGNDPIYAHTGLPGYVALSVAAKVVGAIAGHIAKRRASAHGEGDDPVDLVLELIAAMREVTGNTGPMPSREEVAAKLAEKAAARKHGA